MNDHRLPKQLLYGELSSGKRNTGRPRKRFKDCVKSHLIHTGIHPKKLEHEASDRTKWRSLIRHAQINLEDERREKITVARARRKASSAQPATPGQFPCSHCTCVLPLRNWNCQSLTVIPLACNPERNSYRRNRRTIKEELNTGAESRVGSVVENFL